MQQFVAFCLSYNNYFMTHPSISVSAILLAGGQGTRMNSVLPKQFIKIQNKEIALYSFETLLNDPHITEVIVVCKKEYESLFTTTQKDVRFARPGLRRQDSVYNGFLEVSSHADLICIHDSARPLLKSADLTRVLEEGLIHKAAVLGVPVKSTLKEVTGEGFVLKTLNRTTIWEIQTPQVMTPSLLKEGFRLAHEKNLDVTDDVSLVELQGHPVKCVLGSYSNIKITTPEDLACL